MKKLKVLLGTGLLVATVFAGNIAAYASDDVNDTATVLESNCEHDCEHDHDAAVEFTNVNSVLTRAAALCHTGSVKVTKSTVTGAKCSCGSNLYYKYVYTCSTCGKQVSTSTVHIPVANASNTCNK